MNELTLLGSVAGPRSLALPAKMSFGQWQEVGKALHTCGSATKWWYGDWVIAGEAMFKDKAIQVAAEILGIDPATMTTVVSVCNAFPPNRRRELSFEHHREVYALTPEAQNKWLDGALLGEWTKQELREKMDAAGAKPKAAPRAKKKSAGQKLPTTELYGNLKEEIAVAMQAIPPMVESCTFDWIDPPTRDQLELMNDAVTSAVEALDKMLKTMEGILDVEEKAA